ncbi:MAG TPA: sugar ABC transporter permease [Actinomycetota bacterium]|nr:sugar ABC transporter permease [Actinomycetota bacterium]
MRATETRTRPPSPRRAPGAARPGARARRLRPLVPYGLLAPSLLVLAGVLAYPLYRLLVLSFQQYGLRELFAGTDGRFIGLENYRSILGDSFFWTVVARTVVFAGVCVGLTMVLGTLVALLLRRLGKGMRLLVTAGLVAAWATPVLTAIAVWQWMFDFEFGVMNWLLTRLGVGDFVNHNWFDRPLEGFTVIVLVVVWGALPFVAVTLHAGLTQVPAELEEAARVDGGGAWQVFWNVTFPMLKPVFLILTTLSIIWDFKVFTQIWVMLNQRPGRDYFLLGIWSYSESFGVSNYGKGATIAVVMVVLLMVLTSFYVRQMLRAVEA